MHGGAGVCDATHIPGACTGASSSVLHQVLYINSRDAGRFAPKISASCFVVER